MTKRLRAHFDGKVIVPDEPVDLPRDCALEVEVREAGNGEEAVTPRNRDSDYRPATEKIDGRTPLQQLLKELADLPDDPSTPDDLAAQKNHYLYGQPKQT
jgi:hypothetical protein